MKNFISEITKINTDGLIYKFPEILIGAFKKTILEELECFCRVLWEASKKDCAVISMGYSQYCISFCEEQ